MAQRLVTSVRRAGRIPKSGLFIGNFNILAQVQPKRLELVQFTSQMSSHSPFNLTKGLGKPVGPKAGNKSAAFTAGKSGSDPKFSAFSGCGDGQEGHEEKSSGGPRSGGMNKRQIVFTVGSAAILGVSLQDANDDDNEKQSVPTDLARLVNATNSSDPQIQYDAVRSVRKLLSGDNPPVDSLISSNILPTLVNCLSSLNPALQLEAAWTLRKIAAGSSEQTQAVVQAGAVPPLLKLLTSPHQNACEHAVFTLGNIIGNGPQLRDYVVKLGVVAPLLNLIQPDIPVTLLRNVVWVIINLYSDRDPPPPLQTLQEILPALTILVNHSDPEVLAETVQALSNITGGSRKEQIQMVIDSGVLPKLIQLLNHPEVKVQEAAIRAVSNTFCGTDVQAQAVLNCMALSYFHNLLNDPKEEMSRDALWFLSNITGHNSAQVQAVIDAGLIPLIIRHLEQGEFKIQKEAAWAVSNMAGAGNKEQVAYLIDRGVIPPLFNLLNCKDSEVIQVVLRGIESMLKISAKQDGGAEVCTLIEECGGVDKIESLQNHENKAIRKRAADILKNYFSGHVKEDDLVPEAAETAFQSGPIKVT